MFILGTKKVVFWSVSLFTICYLQALISAYIFLLYALKNNGTQAIIVTIMYFYYKQAFSGTINHPISFYSYPWTSRVRPDPIYHVIFLAKIARKKGSTSLSNASCFAPLKNCLYFGARGVFFYCIARSKREWIFLKIHLAASEHGAIQNSVWWSFRRAPLLLRILEFVCEYTRIMASARHVHHTSCVVFSQQNQSNKIPFLRAWRLFSFAWAALCFAFRLTTIVIQTAQI